MDDALRGKSAMSLKRWKRDRKLRKKLLDPRVARQGLITP